MGVWDFVGGGWDVICFDWVFFCYLEVVVFVFEDVFFVVCGGECIGIIGCVGFGKSIVVRLIVGFYEVDVGVLLFDDVDSC